MQARPLAKVSVQYKEGLSLGVRGVLMLRILEHSGSATLKMQSCSVRISGHLKKKKESERWKFTFATRGAAFPAVEVRIIIIRMDTLQIIRPKTLELHTAKVFFTCP